MQIFCQKVDKIIHIFVSMKEILKKYWGYDSFRPKQQEIITEALAGEDVLAILPTGGGKSICFQVPGMMKEGLSEASDCMSVEGRMCSSWSRIVRPFWSLIGTTDFLK